MKFPVVGLAKAAGESGCEFALCQHSADYRVSLPSRQQPMEVCSVHVTPVVTWGWSGEDDFPVIERLAG